MQDMLKETARLLRGSRELPPSLEGPTPNHSHARYLPKDRDGDGLVDHLTVFASGGLDAPAIRLLALSDRLALPGSGFYDLEPLIAGEAPPLSLAGSARHWISLTPYVAPWPGHSFQEHVRRELVLIGAANKETARHVTVEPVHVLERSKPSAFDLVREDDKPPMPPHAGFLQLELPTPLPGPLVLGYGSHFGLGQFACAGTAG